METKEAQRLAEPPLLVALFDLVQWYGERTERFPKPLRVTLGDRLDGKLLEMLELGVRARYARDPRRHLGALNMDIEIVRYLTRLAHRRNALTLKQYEYVARQLQDIGRQTGGWLRSLSLHEDRQEPVSTSLGL